MIPFFAFPHGGAARGLHHQCHRVACISRLRKIIKTRGHFPSDDAATKLIWLSPAQHHGRLGTRSQGMARGHEPVIAILYEERFTAAVHAAR